MTYTPRPATPYPPAPGPTRHRSAARSIGSWIWAFLPLLSSGLLAWIPILHAAVRLRTRFLAWCLVGYIAAEIAFIVLISAGNETDASVGFGVVIMLGLMIGGTVHAILLRPRVFPSSPPPLGPLPAQQVDAQPAYAAAVAARQRRDEARALAARDPSLARDLRIGRPDLPRQFDDGGLVDVNHVPEQILVQILGLTSEDARKIASARDHMGGLSMPEELTALAGLAPTTVDWVRDRLLFLRF